MSKYFIRGDSEDISWGVWPTNHAGMTDLGYGRGISKSNISPFHPAELVHGGQQASKIYFLASPGRVAQAANTCRTHGSRRSSNLGLNNDDSTATHTEQGLNRLDI
jgi:hypothetical protein